MSGDIELPSASRDNGSDDAALSASRYFLAAIVDSTDDAIIGKSLDGTILSWNRAAAALYGYSAPEIVGKSIATLVPPERRGEVNDILASLRRGEVVDHLETVRVRKDGSPVAVSLTISPIRNEQDVIIGASTIARDVTERDAMARALDAALEQAQAASRLKSEFLATMSHEIRTPMNGVIGMTGMLLDTELDPDQRSHAETVRSSGEALLAIINDILDFSKIEAGKLELEIIDFNLRPVIEELLDMLAQRAHAKGLELVTTIPADVPTRLRGDPGRLRQILTNLLGNAIKFTEHGEVVVRVHVADRSDDGVLLRFEVLDTGSGIPSEAKERLFEVFSQVDASTTRKHGGTGLGLAIAKQLAELMGGEIGVDSEAGAGSTFWFTVRLPEQPDAPPPPVRDGLHDLAVLIVDDNKTNRTILCHQVGSWGMRARALERGSGALEAMRARAATGTPFDIAILDMEMPGMDGLELAEAIQAEPSLAQTRLVLLTSSGVRGSATLARQAGFDAYLTKPVKQSHLYDCLVTVMGCGPESDQLVTRQVLSEARAWARPRLLVAEDNFVNQRVAVAMLAKVGFHADVVADGTEAVEALSSARRYGAVLMDCQMPEMDGFEATAEIRSRETGASRIPIIAMTAGAMSGDREKCLAAGMNDYITKPVDLDALKDVLDRWVTGQPDGQEEAADTAAEASGPIDVARLELLRSLQLDDGPDVLAALVHPFLEEGQDQIAALRAAVTDDDSAAVAYLAHRLRGSSTNLGAQRLGAVCEELEALGRSGDLTPGTEALARLDAQFEIAREALSAAVAASD